MNIKRFFGKNSRDALSQVRKELGDDAVILSNRAVNGGNEIMAFREDEMDSIISGEPRVSGLTSMRNKIEEQRYDSFEEANRLAEPSRPAEHSRLAEASRMSEKSKPVFTEPARTSASSNADSRERSLDDSDAPSLLSMLTRKNSVQESLRSADFTRRAEQAVDNDETLMRKPRQPQRLLNDNTRPEFPTANNKLHMPAAPTMAQAAPALANLQMTEMLNEMRVMRNAIESQLTAMSWGNIQQREPIKSRILSTLLAAGFSAALSRQIAEKVPSSLSYERALVWAQSVLSRNLITIENETEVLDMGGIFALIGPTGVGKTTTTAKLAARYVMKHGTQNLGLITTDAYRVGGHEQLRIYGKILGVMVYAVKDEADLKIALNELKNKHTILIDTVGVSQRDRMVAEQIAMLSNTNSAIKKLLCLNATNTGETLTDVISAYKGKGLDGCIITKIDEAATIGNALDVILREKLKLYYVANGQRVPEDIHMANKQQLIRHAMKLNPVGNKSFQFLNEELPFVMGNTVNTPNADLSEIGYV